MNKTVHYLGLDVHKETIAVSIAPQGSTEVRRYGIINGSLEAVDKLVKKLAQPGVAATQIYTHLMQKPGLGARSPLDG